MSGQEYAGLIGVALGWLLSEASRWIWARREEKKAVAQAIAVLLEIRHRVMAIPEAVEILSRKFNLPPQADAPLKAILSRWFPDDRGLLPRYTDAVALVAAQNPILGFRLNHQDIVIPLLDQLRGLVSSDPNAGEVWRKLEPGLLAAFRSHLDSLIKELAWQRGWLTWMRVGRVLNRTFKPSEALLRMLEDLPVLTEGSLNPEGSGPEVSKTDDS